MKTREELVEELVASSQQLQKAWKQHFHKQLGKDGLPLMPMMLLFVLNERQPVTGSELADFMHISRSAVTQLTDKLDQAGYIEREHDPDDRRVVYLRLSEAGLAKLKQLEDRRKEFFVSASYSLTDEELIQMRLIQSKLIEQIKNQ